MTAKVSSVATHPGIAMGDSGELVVQSGVILLGEPGSQWQVSSESFRNSNRVCLVGDSHLAFGLGNNTAVTGFTVSGGVATITASGNMGIWSGNYFMLANLSDTTLAHPDNATNPIALTGNGGNTITFATTAANGTYTSYAGGSWVIMPVANANDSSWFNWFNAFMGGQYLVTHSFATINSLSTFTSAALSRIVARADYYDIAAVSSGTNDMIAATSIDDANSIATSVLARLRTICDAFLTIGKQVFLTIPPPVGSATGYSAAKIKYVNYGLYQLREGLLEYAQRNGPIVVADLWAATINGTATNGEFVTNYTSDGIHVTTQGLVPFARALATQIRGTKIINRASSFIADDFYGSGYTFVTAQSYPNRTRNSVFAGTGGSVSGTNVTGSGMPGVTSGNWRFTNSGANPTIAYSKVTPTVPTGYYPNWANQRSAARMNITTATTGDIGRITQHDFDNTTNWTAGWYRVSYQLYVRATPTNLGYARIWWNLGNILYAMSDGGANPAGAAGGWPLLIGDVITVQSGPLYLASAPSSNILTIDVVGWGSGFLADVEIMSPQARQFASPY